MVLKLREIDDADVEDKMFGNILKYRFLSFGEGDGG